MYINIYIHIHRYDITLNEKPLSHLSGFVCVSSMASRRLKVGHSGTITCAAISPDASFVVSTGSEALRWPSNGTGMKRLWCLQHGNGGMVGENQKKWSNQWWVGKKYGCFWIRKMLPCFLVDFFLPVNLSRHHGTTRIFSALPKQRTPRIWSPTDPAREPSSFGQCHKSWLRSAMSLSEWTVGEWFLADRTFLLAKSFP